MTSVLVSWQAGPLIHLLLSLPSGLHFWELGLMCHNNNKEMTAFCLYLFTSYPFKEIYLDCVRLNAFTTCSKNIHFKKYIQIGWGWMPRWSVLGKGVSLGIGGGSNFKLVALPPEVSQTIFGQLYQVKLCQLVIVNEQVDNHLSSMFFHFHIPETLLVLSSVGELNNNIV